MIITDSIIATNEDVAAHITTSFFLNDDGSFTVETIDGLAPLGDDCVAYWRGESLHDGWREYDRQVAL